MEILIDRSKMMTTENYYAIEEQYPLVIQHVAYLNGYDITLREASDVWSEYSDSVYCNLAHCDLPDFNGIWEKIKPCFEVTDGTNKEFIDILLNRVRNEYEVVLSIGKKVYNYEL